MVYDRFSNCIRFTTVLRQKDSNLTADAKYKYDHVDNDQRPFLFMYSEHACK